MKSENNRFIKISLLKSEESSTTEEPADWVILRLNSKVSSLEIKYSDLLARVNHFISTLSKNIDKVLEPFSFKEQEKLLSEISYLTGNSDSIYTSSLFADLRNTLIDKLYAKDFSKDTYRDTITSSINNLCKNLGVKDSKHSRRTSQDTGSTSVKQLTPIKSTRRSTSPCDRPSTNYKKENSDLKNSLTEVTKQRDFLKAWKENLTKNPNFDLTAQRIIKGLKDENDLLHMKNTFGQSQLAYIVSSVYKFLSITSKFQRTLREKEGYSSLTQYDNEKYKLELKLRETLENCPDSFKQVYRMNNEQDKKSLKGEGRKRANEPQNVNLKLIDEISKQYTEKIDSLSNAVVKLETDNRALKNKFYCANKELKQARTMSEVKVLENTQKFSADFSQAVKGNILKNVKNFALKVLGMFDCVEKMLKEKEKRVEGLKGKITKVLKENLRTLIVLNEKVENEYCMINYKDQIENLNYVVEQKNRISESQLRNLESALNDSETEKTRLEWLIIDLEQQNLALQKKNSHLQNTEKTIDHQSNTIKELEDQIKDQESEIQKLKMEKIILQQFKFERDSYEKQNSELNKEISAKTRDLLQIQEDFKAFENENSEIIYKLQQQIRIASGLSNYLPEAQDSPSQLDLSHSVDQMVETVRVSWVTSQTDNFSFANKIMKNYEEQNTQTDEFIESCQEKYCLEDAERVNWFMDKESQIGNLIKNQGLENCLDESEQTDFYMDKCNQTDGVREICDEIEGKGGQTEFGLEKSNQTDGCRERCRVIEDKSNQIDDYSEYRNQTSEYPERRESYSDQRHQTENFSEKVNKIDNYPGIYEKVEDKSAQTENYEEKVNQADKESYSNQSSQTENFFENLNQADESKEKLKSENCYEKSSQTENYPEKINLIEDYSEKLNQIENYSENLHQIEKYSEKSNKTDNYSDKFPDLSDSLTENSVFNDDFPITNPNISELSDTEKSFDSPCIKKSDHLGPDTYQLTPKIRNLRFSHESPIFIRSGERLEIEIKFTQSSDFVKLKEEFLGIKKMLLYKELEKEVLEVELKEIRKNFKVFSQEFFDDQEKFGRVSGVMNKLDLSNYKPYS